MRLTLSIVLTHSLLLLLMQMFVVVVLLLLMVLMVLLILLLLIVIGKVRHNVLLAVGEGKVPRGRYHPKRRGLLAPRVEGRICGAEATVLRQRHREGQRQWSQR